jgi:hypothetical protein
MKPTWSKFEQLDIPKFTPADFCETLDGGQSFRWYETEASSSLEPEYIGAFGNVASILKLSKTGKVLCSVHKRGTEKLVEEYLDGTIDTIEFLDVPLTNVMTGDPTKYPVSNKWSTLATCGIV